MDQIKQSSTQKRVFAMGPKDTRGILQQLRDIGKPQSLVKISALAAISVLLMTVLQFPLPFALPFLKVDFADVPALIGGFALGPVAGIVVEGIKILLNLLINGTMTAGVGELSNFLLGATFVGTAASIYKRHKTFGSAVFGLAFGAVAMTVLAVLSNGFFVFPLYATAFQMDLSDFVQMGAGLNGFVDSYWNLMFFMIVPFNLIKSALASMITLLLYKKISPILKSHR